MTDEKPLLLHGVDLEDCTPDECELYARVALIFEECFETFVAKNRDYGNSLVETAREKHRKTPYYDDVVEAFLDVTYSQCCHKDNRFVEQAFGGGADQVGEDVAETVMDNINYWAWLAVATRDAKTLVASVGGADDTSPADHAGAIARNVERREQRREELDWVEDTFGSLPTYPTQEPVDESVWEDGRGGIRCPTCDDIMARIDGYPEWWFCEACNRPIDEGSLS